MFSTSKTFGFWEENTVYKGFYPRIPQTPLKEWYERGKKTYSPTAINYLKRGKIIWGDRGLINDILNPDKLIQGGSSSLTDGVWVWSYDVAYYLETYQILLPDEFLKHMESRNFKLPVFSRDDYRNIIDEFESLFMSNS